MHISIGIPIYDDLGNIDGGVITYRDIGDRIEAEKERLLKKDQELQREILEAKLLKAEKERLMKIADTHEFEFIRCSYPDLEILSINGNAFNRIRDINKGIDSTDSLIGKKFNTIYPIYEKVKIKEWKYLLFEEKDFTNIDYTKQTIDGKERFFKTIIHPMFGANNKITEIIFITTDITEEVKAKNKIEDTIEMQNQMFSTVSHELKTPLNVIFSATQLMEIYLKDEKEGIKKESMSKSINIIKQNCYRFTKLINNIIDLSSIESGFYKLNFSKNNIVEIVENIVDSLRSFVEDKGLSIIFDTEIEEKIIALDVDKIERIILNLVSNAVKYSDKGGKIYININDKVDFVEILVQDCGIGIDEIHLNTIFDKYKMIDSSLSRNAEGSGIGLSLVKTMVELMGGEISVESELGKGSLFIVRLPVKILDESELIDTIKHSDSLIEKINIELSDIYNKK